MASQGVDERRAEGTLDVVGFGTTVPRIIPDFSRKV